MLTDHDVYLFREGTLFRAYEKLGAHVVGGNVAATDFAVWAPNARTVSVIGDFNGWNPDATPLTARGDSSGIWEGRVSGVRDGTLYKFRIVSQAGDFIGEKADPYALRTEEPPRTASVVWRLDYTWQDGDWMSRRASANALDAPMSIYEVHLGSWRRSPEEGDRPLTYREMAPLLADYVYDMGFTHVELMPVMEHPFYGSWGYQVTGYFAPSARYGTPQDFMYLVDHLHERGIGVLLDWVPSHFPNDPHGLAYFDGTHLHEHADPRQGFHPEWSSAIFNYGRAEVRNFLGSSALFWLERYHADGLRVDAVASMLYLDYARREGEWVPNRFGGRENLDAVYFLRSLNEATYRDHPDTQTIAEESTAWPMVSRPVWLGGLGFGMKWNMGWMHDTLKYFQTDPLFRRYQHDKLTFSIWYAFTENFVLPLSHDEVVHGKGSLIGKMPGDEWQHDESLEWHVLRYPLHEGVRRWVRELNRFYRGTPAMYQRDFTAEGFEWIDCNDRDNSVIAFIRRGTDAAPPVVVVCNFTPIVRENYRIGVPRGGVWHERLNSDAREYGGSGQGNFGAVEAAPLESHGRTHTLYLRLPPLGAVFLTPA